MTRVVVVDDHPVVREGLKRIIAESPEFTIAGEAGDGEEALKVVREVPCDVVLLDITLPKKNGLEVLKQLKTEQPRTPVIVLSMHSEDEYAIRMLRSGAAGYLTKESTPAHLVTAIRKVLRGGRYVSTALAEKLAFNLQSDMDRPAHEALSDREYQILCMLSSGKTVSEIAADLSLSVKTISTYRVRVLEKLRLKNNAELTRYAIKQGLVA
jgi:two-component system, NarL family, invasion response regulator UvrY